MCVSSTAAMTTAENGLLSQKHTQSSPMSDRSLTWPVFLFLNQMNVWCIDSLAWLIDVMGQLSYR